MASNGIAIVGIVTESHISGRLIRVHMKAIPMEAHQI